MKCALRKRFVKAFGLICLLLAACQPAPNQLTATPETPTPSTSLAPGSSAAASTGQPSASPSPLAVEPSPTPTTGVERGTGSFDLTDPTQGLANLDSYRATLSLNFNGTTHNQPLTWATTYTLTVVTKQPARLLVQSMTGTTPAPRVLVDGEIGGIAYQAQDDKPCSAAVIQPADDETTILEPAQLLPVLLGAETTGASETLAGLSADHYRFDQRALGLDQGTAAGEVWAAASGGMILKYVLTVQAGEDQLGAGISGTTQWEYELTDVNQAASVEPLPGCPSGLVDVPRLNDAVILVNQPGILSYKTTASLQSALDFYRTQLTVAGWQAMGSPVSAGDFGAVGYVRGDRRLSIVITQKNGTIIRLVLARISP